MNEQTGLATMPPTVGMVDEHEGDGEEVLPTDMLALLAPLTGKQRLFVLAYVGTACFNQTQAASVAGYKHPNEEIWRLMVNPAVRAAIEGFLAPRIMGAHEILARLDEQARLDVSEFFDFVEGKPVFNATKAMASGKMHLIKGFEYSKNGDLQVVFHDPQAALTLIGKHRKLFVDRIEHSGNLDVTTLSDDELAAVIAGKAIRPA